MLVQALFIYIWLTVLSPLSVTDTYYSVYLLCAVVGLLCLYDNYRTPAECTRGQGITVGVFAGVLAAAVALANYELFEPLTVLQNLFDCVCALAGGFCIGYQILLCMLKRLPLQSSPSARLHPGRVFFLVFGSVSLINLLYLFFVLYPGVLTTDSFTTVSQLMGLSPYDNVMPFWHTVTVKVFFDLGMALFGEINAAIATFHVAQILFMAGCIGFAMMTMYQMGLPVPVMAAVYALYAFMPYNMVYSITLYKDIPFGGAALLFVTAFYRLLKNIGRHRMGNYAALVIGALGFSLWRTNGWYAFLVMVILMVFLMRKEQKRLLLVMIAVLILCWVLINPVLSALDVGETNFVEAFGIPMQQIARVMHEERPLTQEQLSMISEIFWIDKVGALYDPQTVDPVKFNTFRYDKVDYILENLDAYLELYFDLAKTYPGDFLKAWVEQTKGYWNGGYKFWTYTLQMGENNLGIYRTESTNLLSRLYNAWFRYVEKPTILQPLISIGLYVWALVSCCVVNVLKKQKEFLLTIPILVLIAGLWLGTPVFSEFRYAYPMILSMPMILAATVYPVREE